MSVECLLVESSILCIAFEQGVVLRVEEAELHHPIDVVRLGEHLQSVGRQPAALGEESPAFRLRQPSPEAVHREHYGASVSLELNKALVASE